MDKLIELMKGMPNFYAEKGATAEDIELAEKSLGMKFAADFKEYLQEFGAVSYGSHELTGFSTDKNLCVVEATQKNLKKHPTVQDLYVIEEAHIDGIVIWQDTDGNVYETYPHSEPRRIAHSLAEYIIG